MSLYSYRVLIADHNVSLSMVGFFWIIPIHCFIKKLPCNTVHNLSQRSKSGDKLITLSYLHDSIWSDAPSHYDRLPTEPFLIHGRESLISFSYIGQIFLHSGTVSLIGHKRSSWHLHEPKCQSIASQIETQMKESRLPQLLPCMCGYQTLHNAGLLLNKQKPSSSSH